MIAALACFVTAGILFVEHDVEGIVVGRPNFLTGEASTNFRNADFDGDGAQDLLFADRISLQRGGEFPPTLSIALPMLAERPEYDIFDQLLFLRIPGRIEVYRLDGLTWERVLSHALEWPDLKPRANGETIEATKVPRRGHLSRYLHDLSGDGLPEIVILGLDGLHVYEQDGDAYRQTHVLQILPPRKVRLPRGKPLWPSAARVTTFPANHLNFRLLLGDQTIATLSNKNTADGNLRHTITRWQIHPENGLILSEEAPAVHNTPPLPSFLQPCRLNSSQAMGFAGVRWEFSENTIVPERIYETAITTDGGKTLQSFRSKSFQTLSALLDFDGDDDLDIVLESTGLYRGGLREFLTRSTTERALRHSLHVHLQDHKGHFSDSPDVRFNTSVGLAKPPFRNGFLFREYQNGGSFNLTGDLNGDGLKDLVVRNRAGRLYVYFNQDLGYAKSPDRALRIDPTHSFAIADVDADGNSDIVIQRPGPASNGKASRVARVYFSRNTPQ